MNHLGVIQCRNDVSAKHLADRRRKKKKATTKNENEASTVTEGSKRTFQGESCEMLRSSEMEILLFDLKHFSFGAG